MFRYTNSSSSTNRKDKGKSKISCSVQSESSPLLDDTDDTVVEIYRNKSDDPVMNYKPSQIVGFELPRTKALENNIAELQACLLIVENAISERKIRRNVITGSYIGSGMILIGVALLLGWLIYRLTSDANAKINEILDPRNNILSATGTPLNFIGSNDTACTFATSTADLFRENYDHQSIKLYVPLSQDYGYFSMDACLRDISYGDEYRQYFYDIMTNKTGTLRSMVPNIEDYRNLTAACFEGLANLCYLMTRALPPEANITLPIIGITLSSLLAMGLLIRGKCSHHANSDPQEYNVRFSDDNKNKLSSAFGKYGMNPDLVNKVSYSLNTINLLLNQIKRQIAANSTFSRAAVAGMLLMRSPRESNELAGIPVDIGRQIGDYLTLNDAGRVAQTCWLANQSSANQVSRYFNKT